MNINKIFALIKIGLGVLRRVTDRCTPSETTYGPDIDMLNYIIRRHGVSYAVTHASNWHSLRQVDIMLYERVRITKLVIKELEHYLDTKYPKQT